MKIISKDHNNLFEMAQTKYLAERNDKNLGELYLILIDYYKNLFICYTHKKGLTWEDEEIEEKANDASTRIIERYLFKIDSLTGYIYNSAIKTLIKKNVITEEYTDKIDDQYSKLQAAYFCNRNQSNEKLIKDYLYKQYKDLFTKCAANGIKGPGGITLNCNSIEESSHTIVDKILSKYNFKIDKLSSYGHWDFVKILYQDKEYEMRTSSLEDFYSLAEEDCDD